ncbi:predicted protein [Nematostella vectensis]|uniref:EGF-like domain-containing protein n=1 Tax=Nematostella vectensis TaxID=45351 RepID=A7SE72_NEMVE|nr:predicted protein [Nematostella vectensis]|eukprot:XP_001630020.1 predicted protein [Nematostella vectensis]
MSTLIRMCFWMVVLVTSMDSSNGKKRLPIPKSLLVPGAKGIDVIDEAVELVDEAQIFSEDHHFTKRIAIVQSAINASSNGGGLWQVDLCVFREVTQNRRKYTNLVRLQKLVRRKLGITWSRVRHHDLRRPLYSILAARLALETTVESFPKNVKSQARIWAQNYHKCPETSGAYTPPEEANKLDENTFVKVVKNSCYSGYNKCEHFCHELPQGRTACSCRKSFTLQPDGKSCKEVKASEIKVAEEPLELNPDPRSCVVNGNQCEQSCIKVRGIVKCTCRQGFVLHNNEFSCFDMDECELSPCDHECHNTPGSYCTCKKGYTLQTDMVTCKQDHGNCSVNDVGCLDRCPGCPCPPGMSRQNGHCVETDEFSLYKGVCHHNCVNTPRGYRCACSPGYSLDENGISCSDTDECATGAHTCHHNCINVPGGYFCSCAKGFRLNYDLKTCVVAYFVCMFASPARTVAYFVCMFASLARIVAYFVCMFASLARTVFVSYAYIYVLLRVYMTTSANATMAVAVSDVKISPVAIGVLAGTGLAYYPTGELAKMLTSALATLVFATTTASISQGDTNAHAHLASGSILTGSSACLPNSRRTRDYHVIGT